jgi:glutaredoxin/glutathione-dependent peroxiredoxin
MQITIGDSIPEFEVSAITSAGQETLTADQIFGNKRVVLFGVPGAFTPTCNDNHLPGYLISLDALKSKGVDRIVCICVNDIHVVKAWAKHANVDGKIDMLSDGNADVARALGLDVALNAFGMGTRNKRFSMVVENKVVKKLNIEEKSGVNVSGADTLLGQL